jgi:TolA-binding protein
MADEESANTPDDEELGAESGPGNDETVAGLPPDAEEPADSPAPEDQAAEGDEPTSSGITELPSSDAQDQKQAGERTGGEAQEQPDSEAKEQPSGEVGAADEGSQEPSAEPEEEQDVGEQPSEEAGEPEAAGAPDADEIVPPDVATLPIPIVGTLSIRSLAILVCLVALVFVGVLFVGLKSRSVRRAPVAVGAALSAETASEATSEGILLADLSGLGHDELMEQAAKRTADEDYAAAVRLYREAAGREEAGLPKVLLARHKLAEALASQGDYGEAQLECESLRSVTRPGDELWKNALISSIRILSASRDWDEFFRHLCLLRANSARYADEAALNRWLAYCRAMAMVQMFLQRSGQETGLYGIEPPAFGQARYAGRPLVPEEIMPASGKYGDGTLEAKYEMGELHLLSEGASLSEVLKATADATGLSIDYSGPAQYRVSAALQTLSPQHALELVLGSVGLAAQERDEELVVERMDPVPKSNAEALSAALWELQEFLILYPDSAPVPEAYYALGHLYMSQGQNNTALDQLVVLCKEFPETIWATYGHYIAGRMSCDLKNWRRAERELLAVVDSAVEHPLMQSGFLWAAHAQAQLGKYSDAVACFRRALAHEVKDPLTPEILYNIALCLERSGASALEVEERYAELRTRFPTSEYAREADYRLARMAFDAGKFGKAARRYEFYLSAWPIESERARQACRDLVFSYMNTGDCVRAVLLSEVMCSAFGRKPEYCQALPALLEAYREAELQQVGLAFLERSMAATSDPRQQSSLLVEKARLLVDLKEFDEASALVALLKQNLRDPDLLYKVRLVEAQMLVGQGQRDEGIEVCRQVALKCSSQETCAAALKLMGRYYELTKQFDKAALAYAGKCPMRVERSAP